MRFFDPEGGVRLEVLDWGGTGEAILFLAGGGSSAHYFDDFAPRFRSRFRVLGLTRRGHGASSDAPFDLSTLVADIHTLLDHVGIERVHLAGFSWAGEELTRFAITHPDRVRTLTYLDAALDRTDPADERILQRAPTAPRGPDDMRSLTTVRAWMDRYRGHPLPPGELRAIFDLEEDGRIRGPRLTPETRRRLNEAEEPPRYSEIVAPALAIYALHDSPAEAFPWVMGDSAAMARALRFPVRSYLEARGHEIERFRAEMPRGRVVILQGPHDIVLADPEGVARTMREFLNSAGI